MNSLKQKAYILIKPIKKWYNNLNISVQNLGSFRSMTLVSVDGTYNGAVVNSSRVELNGSGNATATNAGQPVACTWNATGVWSR